MSSLPQTIDCLVQQDINKPAVTRTRIALQRPDFQKGEHLIKVKCVAPCADELRWAPFFPGTFSADKAFVPCFDFTGTVVLAPENSPFPPGSSVFAAGRFENTGSAREYTVARASDLALTPRSLSSEQAATIPISALTAYQALFEHGRLARGWENDKKKTENASKRLVITAAAGGVGTWALQLARAAGVGSVIAVCGPNNIDHVKSLGATSVIDYKSSSLDEWADSAGDAKADVALDMVGGKTLAACWKAIKADGMLVSVNEPTANDRPADKKESQGLWFIFEPNGAQLADITGLIEKGLVKPAVDSVWSFDQFQEAFDRVETGHCRGKVVIKVAE